MMVIWRSYDALSVRAIPVRFQSGNMIGQIPVAQALALDYVIHSGQSGESLLQYTT